jgi:hypothetical protein
MTESEKLGRKFKESNLVTGLTVDPHNLNNGQSLTIKCKKSSLQAGRERSLLNALPVSINLIKL